MNLGLYDPFFELFRALTRYTNSFKQRALARLPGVPEDASSLGYGIDRSKLCALSEEDILEYEGLRAKIDMAKPQQAICKLFEGG